MNAQPYLVLEPRFEPLPGRPDVLRLMHSGCAGVEFRYVAPNPDASRLEIGRGKDDLLYAREPFGGTSQAKAWQVGKGTVSCATCWDSQRTDNTVLDLETGKVGTA